MAIDRTRCGDQPVGGDHLRVRADAGSDIVHRLRIAGAADRGDPSLLDTEARLDDAEHRVEHQSADDYDVEFARRRSSRDGHARADSLRPAVSQFVSVGHIVALDAYPEVGITEAHQIAGRRTVAERIVLPREFGWHQGPPAPAMRTSSTSRVSPGPQRSVLPAGISR